MFSFFKSSKKSPAVSPTENKNEENTQKSGDDFEFLKNPNSTASNIYPPSVYPQFNQNSSPLNPTASPQNHPLNRQFSLTVNYTASVPFKLNPSLLQNDNESEVWNFKLREMNSLLQRINVTDYDFKLERSIVDGRES
ncbi:hypothetical protein PVAND_013103 [Polypedilum vanderplanki]|uniref:UMA domain-containing protein n=1 Tax=Polypedilum vanderplanki TaxID=319348 RepID=A0A9J6CPF2_POLVA|nr:hypothetical protein PVAND_013103 [Polypedilum vanderplanki]